MEKKRDWLLPASIVVAALLISVSLFYNAGSRSDEKSANVAPEETPWGAAVGVRPVSSNDHIRGSVDAPIKIIEYSDLECPFCKRFHPVMQQVLQNYDDKVAWVYRHLPLDTLHPKARKEAEATECAAAQGGNDAFWAYVDRIFEVTPSNNGLDLNILPEIASEIGLDKDVFQSCLQGGKYAERIASDVADADKAGARGTPFSLILKGEKVVGAIPGALPFEQVKILVDGALK